MIEMALALPEKVVFELGPKRQQTSQGDAGAAHSRQKE